MKKTNYFLCLFFFFFTLLPVQALELDINSTNAYLLNLDENKVLYEKNAQEPVAIASLTKIMTALVALDQINNLDEQVVITAEDLKGLKEANASVAGFRIGQKVTYRDLLYGLLLPSGADAAKALTRLIAGNRENFVNMMNEKAKVLGLTNTVFQNETGLDAENQYSTVEEVAILFQESLKNPTFREIIQSSHYTMSDYSFSVTSTVEKKINTSGLSLDYILGGKTGTTENAGLCLASIASKNGSNYLLITTGASQTGKKVNHIYDAKTIYDYFMTHFQNATVLEKGEALLTINTKYTKEESITYSSEETIIKYLPIDFKKEDLTIKYTGLNNITSKEKIGTKLGDLSIFYQGELITTMEIILDSSLHFDFIKYLEANPYIITIPVIGILFLIMFRILKKCKKRKKSR